MPWKGAGHLPEGNRKPVRVISRVWQDLIRILGGHSRFQREYRLQETRRMWGDPVGGQASSSGKMAVVAMGWRGSGDRRHSAGGLVRRWHYWGNGRRREKSHITEILTLPVAGAIGHVWDAGVSSWRRSIKRPGRGIQAFLPQDMEQVGGILSGNPT